MTNVGVNPPKTPVSEDSLDTAAATLPNVCKMPGPPAPFVPTPLPNLGRSADRLDDATTTVKIRGKKVAIKGSSYMSQPSGDVASQGTGGGVISSKTQGKTKFVAPGSMNVKADGQNIQLLGDAMTNNGGSPDNSGAVANSQASIADTQMELGVDCAKKTTQKKHRWGPCEVEQLCAMIKAYNESPDPKFKPERTPSKPASKFSGLTEAQVTAQNVAFGKYTDSLESFSDNFNALVKKKEDPYHDDVVKQFHTPCLHRRWADPPPDGMGAPIPVPRSKVPGAMSPDHMHPVNRGGTLPGKIKWADSNVNSSVGKAMDKHDETTHPGGVKAQPSCNCPA